MLTFESLLDFLVPALLLAAIFGGIRVHGDVRSIAETMKQGFDRIHGDIHELKMQTKSHDDRIRKVEISQARREGREEADN